MWRERSDKTSFIHIILSWVVELLGLSGWDA